MSFEKSNKLLLVLGNMKIKKTLYKIQSTVKDILLFSKNKILRS